MKPCAKQEDETKRNTIFREINKFTKSIAMVKIINSNINLEEINLDNIKITLPRSNRCTCSHINKNQHPLYKL